MSAHKGRCFRAWRGTVRRKRAQGLDWQYPIRQKVPLALRPFLAAESSRQLRAGANAMSLAITRYTEHQIRVGGAQKRAARGR